MEIFTLINLITLALASHANLLQAQEYPALVSQEDTFKQLCISEYKAKLEYNNCVSQNTETDLFEKYLKLMDSRILLGSQLNMHSCPPELFEGISNEPNLRREQQLSAYDLKCQAEVKASVLCSKFAEASQLADSHATFFEDLMKRQQAACLEFKTAVKSKRRYAMNYSIIDPCDEELSEKSTKLAEAEFDQWYQSLPQPRPILKPESPQSVDPSQAAADTKNKDKKSSKSKTKFGLFKFFHKSEVKS